MRPLRISRESATVNHNSADTSRTSAYALVIEWDDKHLGRHLLSSLRSYCPCASCRTEGGDSGGMIMLPVLTPGQHELVGIEPVGAYALQLIWGDGHRTGIYSFDYLREICECEDCLNKRKG